MSANHAPRPSGFKWPVGVARTIAAPAADIWTVISAPGNLEPCHPFCESNPVTTWPGVGSRDEVRYLNGIVYERRFTAWMDGVGYDLDIGLIDGPTSQVSWRIEPADDGHSSLRIVVFPDVLQRTPVAIRWVPHLLKVRPLLRFYLSSVLGGFEWYLTRGEPVPRDHFGRHPWFSSTQ